MYRKGGEELVVLLHGADLSGGVTAGERFRRAVADASLPHGGHPESPTVTTSIGVAVGPRPGEDPERVLALAGLAMLTAKQRGRNRVETEPMWELPPDAL